MATLLRIPITIASGNCYTAYLLVGSQATPVNVLLDTGSSMTAVNVDQYNPGTDLPAATTTNWLQSGSFQGAARFIAALVQAPLGLQGDAGTVTVPNGNLGVVYKILPSLFGNADGILGLGYQALNAVTVMPGNTWDSQYTPAQLVQGHADGTKPPYVDQLVAARDVANKFAFAVRRSVVSAAADAASSGINTGVFVLGGGEECDDLYTGAFTSVAVVNESYYSTNLVAVQVGNRQPVPVPPPPAGSLAASNSFLDSGASGLRLDPALYNQVIEQFNAVNPAFGPALQGASRDQTQINLGAWPTLGFVLEGPGGARETLQVAAKDYWQFDGYGPGTATAELFSGGAPHPGQSILGLPMFAGKYVVFDRTGGPGRGVVKFATLAEAAPLVA
jgi:hypothetical protein